VIDRYNVVLQIFKRHARTHEAKLQVDDNFFGQVYEIKFILPNPEFHLFLLSILMKIFFLLVDQCLTIFQVQLAEIPYLRSRLIGDFEMELISKYDKSARKGESYFERERFMLSRYE